jgi:hypothetical protein
MSSSNIGPKIVINIVNARRLRGVLKYSSYGEAKVGSTRIKSNPKSIMATTISITEIDVISRRSKGRICEKKLLSGREICKVKVFHFNKTTIKIVLLIIIINKESSAWLIGSMRMLAGKRRMNTDPTII